MTGNRPGDFTCPGRRGAPTARVVGSCGAVPNTGDSTLSDEHREMRNGPRPVCLAAKAGRP
jgi:hypothetical protein